MTEIEIREATPSDAEDISRRIKTQNTPDEIREQISMFERSVGCVQLVAVAEDGVVGNIVMMPTRYFPTGQPHRAELADIVVAGSHQGTGLLQKLVDAAIERARAMGVSQVETSAWSSNERAVAAYRKVGFAEWGRLPDAIKREDGSYDTLVCFVREV